MASLPQTEANQRNAQSSTGPKTAEGRAAASKNARKHGLLSQELVLPDEDAEMLSELTQELLTALQPEGGLERVLVERIIEMTWRLRRVEMIETGIFTLQSASALVKRARADIREIAEVKKNVNTIIMYSQLDKPDENVHNQPKYKAAVAESQRLEDRLVGNAATLGLAFIHDSNKENALAKLSRYETSIERSLYRALHELERRQAARKGQHVPTPVAIDIDVTGLPERINSSGE